MDKVKTARVLDKITEWALYILVFIIPFSKTAIEACITIAFFSWILRRVLRLNLTDFQSGFRALGKMAATKIILKHRRTYTHEMIVEARKKDLQILEIPMTVNSRTHGNSKVVSSVIRYALAQTYIIITTLVRKSD